LGAILAVALGACTHNETASVQTPGQTRALAKAIGCPMAQLSDVHAVVTDIDDGAAVTFVAPQEERDQLRKDVQAMNEANDKQGNAFLACTCSVNATGSAEAMPGEPGETRERAPSRSVTNTPSAAATMPAASASVHDTETGAVLKLTAKEKAQVAELRTATRQYTRAMKNCTQPAQGQGAPSTPR
jgi:hypothetical protein